MSQENVETIRRLLDAYNRGDYDAAAELTHPDVLLVPPGDQSPYRGRDALRQWMEPNAFEEQRFEARAFTTARDRVLLEAHAWMTGASSGIELEVDFWSLWSFDEAGLITRCEAFLDRRPAFDAIGLT